MTITKTVDAPIFGEMISPSKLAGMSLSEIKKLDVQIGNKTYKMDQVFSVEESGAEKKLVLVGDLSHVRFIGRGMTEGSISVEGKAGPYLGNSMKGGDIIVKGSADSWLGARMLGGTIEIHGNAGDFVGAAYRGSLRGIKNGSIKIHGSCGSWLGLHARGGLIWVDGDTGLFPGMHMTAGEIYIGGGCGGMPGAEMTGGKIAVSGHLSGSVLPGFSYNKKSKPKIGGVKHDKQFYAFTGDIAQGGSGRLYVGVEANPHLQYLEDL